MFPHENLPSVIISLIFEDVFPWIQVPSVITIITKKRKEKPDVWEQASHGDKVWKCDIW